MATNEWIIHSHSAVLLFGKSQDDWNWKQMKLSLILAAHICKAVNTYVQYPVLASQCFIFRSPDGGTSCSASPRSTPFLFRFPDSPYAVWARFTVFNAVLEGTLKYHCFLLQYVSSVSWNIIPWWWKPWKMVHICVVTADGHNQTKFQHGLIM